MDEAPTEVSRCVLRQLGRLRLRSLHFRECLGSEPRVLRSLARSRIRDRGRNERVNVAYFTPMKTTRIITADRRWDEEIHRCGRSSARVPALMAGGAAAVAQRDRKRTKTRKPPAKKALRGFREFSTLENARGIHGCRTANKRADKLSHESQLLVRH